MSGILKTTGVFRIRLNAFLLRDQSKTLGVGVECYDAEFCPFDKILSHHLHVCEGLGFRQEDPLL